MAVDYKEEKVLSPIFSFIAHLFQGKITSSSDVLSHEIIQNLMWKYDEHFSKLLSQHEKYTIVIYKEISRNELNLHFPLNHHKRLIAIGF